MDEISYSIDSSLTRLAASRKQIEEQKSFLSLLEAELAASELYQRIQTGKEQLTRLASLAKTDDENVRSVALDIFDRDSEENKAIRDGVSIAEYTTFEIEENLAIAWASEHHQKALKLNLTEIKKVAKAGMEVDGVVLGKENRVKIASDLSSYLTNSN